jgi:hypothetical protein
MQGPSGWRHRLSCLTPLAEMRGNYSIDSTGPLALQLALGEHYRGFGLAVASGRSYDSKLGAERTAS